MSFKIPNNFSSFCADNFEWALKIMDNFVERVLIGSDNSQKKKLVEKLKRYQELAELLVEKEQPNIQTIAYFWGIKFDTFIQFEAFF